MTLGDAAVLPHIVDCSPLSVVQLGARSFNLRLGLREADDKLAHVGDELWAWHSHGFARLDDAESAGAPMLDEPEAIAAIDEFLDKLED